MISQQIFFNGVQDSPAAVYYSKYTDLHGRAPVYIIRTFGNEGFPGSAARTAGNLNVPNSTYLMASPGYAGKFRAFLLELKMSCCRERRNFYAYITRELIFLLGLLRGGGLQRVGLARTIGMLFTGIILGPYVLEILDVSIT